MSQATPLIRTAKCVTRIAALLSLAAPVAVNAYTVNSYLDGDQTLYLKWGDNHAGTLGSTVYWSFIPPGTSGSAYCTDACPGTSGSSITVELSPGNYEALAVTALEPDITAMMALWSAATGVDFVKLDSDSGVAINDAAAVPPATGQIRIGVFAFNPIANGSAAVGYSPPPNGGTGSGDILFNSNAYYQFAPGNQGDAYQTTFAPNDIDGLILHELGHAIGLEHPVHVDGQCPIMDVADACFGFVNRELGADDRAGAMFLYDTLFASGFE